MSTSTSSLSLSKLTNSSFSFTNSNPRFNMPNTNHNRHSPPKHNPKLLSIILKFIIMSCILSLFLIFLGLATILVLHTLLVGSFLHRRRQQQPSISAYSFLDLQNHLTCYQYSADVSADCSVCLEGFKQGEFCRALPVCDHIFHAHCVDSWLVKVSNCPVCRTPVQFDVDRPTGSSFSDDECKLLWAIGVGRQ